MAIDALIFDLDDTLMAQDASDEAALLAACTLPGDAPRPEVLAASVLFHARLLWAASPTYPYCNRVGISTVEGLWAGFAGDGVDLAALRAWAPAYRLQTWSTALAEHGIHDSERAGEGAVRFMDERRARHVVFPETREVLDDLRGDYRLALLTNGAPDLQREKLRGSGLSDYFDAVVVSGDLGIGKPDPRIFARVLGGLGCAPERAAMVGDNPARDIAGALACGIYAVWVDRPGIVRQCEIVPDATIADLRGLRAVLHARV